jgi:putative mRNA 3-end processing factor
MNNDLQLLISDHVDWNDIITMLKEVEPTQVWTLHGNGTYLKEHFKGKLLVKLLNHAD